MPLCMQCNFGSGAAGLLASALHPAKVTCLEWHLQMRHHAGRAHLSSMSVVVISQRRCMRPCRLA